MVSVGAARRPVAAAVPPLPTATRHWYGLGQTAEGIKNQAFVLFLLFYYTQVLGLAGTLAGLALAIALLFDALTDPLAGVGRRRCRAQTVTERAGGQRALAVDRLAERIDHPSEPGVGRPDDRLGGRDLGLAAQADSIQGSERHEDRMAFAKADRLTDHGAAVARHHPAALTDRKAMVEASHLDHQAENAVNPPIELMIR